MGSGLSFGLSLSQLCKVKLLGTYWCLGQMSSTCYKVIYTIGINTCLTRQALIYSSNLLALTKVIRMLWLIEALLALLALF